jgi:hypothetical protein
MSKMSPHDPFNHLKHKLWPKEGLGVKLPIWLPNTKSQKSPWFICMQVACHIPLESSWGGLKLWFISHFNWRSTQEIMSLQSCKNPNFGNFEIPNLGVLKQNDIWVHASWPCIKNTIKGKMMASPKSRWWWVLWICVCTCSSMHQKCSNYALTNLLFGLCRFVWIIELLINFPSPYLGILTPPSTPKVLWTKESTPTPCLSVVFTFGLTIEFIQEFGGASIKIPETKL